MPGGEQSAAPRPDDLLAVSGAPAAVEPRPTAADADPATDQLVQAYESSFEQAIATTGSIYEPMSPMLLASHERRMALLDALPVGDLSNRVCVDYGVGSWGFGIIFPRLHRCRLAIGIDISKAAIRESERVSAEGSWPYGRNYAYLTSRGDDLGLPDSSVDLFFAGESIEHVENTEAFLDEVHRVLKPGGLFVLTTPNADAYFYRIAGERYCVNPEHVALMSWEELRHHLRPAFEIVVAKGFNGSLHHSRDDEIRDPDVARAWAAQFADRPDLATGVVVMARRRDHYDPGGRIVERRYHHESPLVSWEGTWTTVPLHRTMTGRNGLDGDGSVLTLDFEGTDLLVFLYAHSWGGHAFVEVDASTRFVDLYSPQPGFCRVGVHGLPSGPHRLQVRGSLSRNPRSESNQLIFYQAISYTREGGSARSRPPAPPPSATALPRLPPAAEEVNVPPSHDIVADACFSGTRPRRLSIVYTVPARMPASERLLLYSLVFGMRPQRCLVLGNGDGGAALIVDAALDDVGAGRLVSVDPRRAVAPESLRHASHRTIFVAGTAPSVLDRAVEVSEGPFELVLLDGDLVTAAVIRDVESVLPRLAPSAYLLVHDANHDAVAEAIAQLLWKHADRLVDCGMLAVEQTTEPGSGAARPLVRGGLRLLRFHAPA